MAHGFSDNKEKVEIIDDINRTINGLLEQISTLQSQVSTVQNDVGAVQNNVSTLQTRVSTLQTKETKTETNLNNYWKTIYPVGSIFISVSSTNPKTLFGGTWVAWGSGRVPVGVNANDNDFNTVEKTGGEKKHILTVSEIPSHSHNIKIGNNVVPGNNLFGVSNETGQATTEYAGGGQSHNNLQPYITCYMFKRTA